jgi:hypothetical protein
LSPGTLIVAPSEVIVKAAAPAPHKLMLNRPRPKRTPVPCDVDRMVPAVKQAPIADHATRGLARYAGSGSKPPDISGPHLIADDYAVT